MESNTNNSFYLRGWKGLSEFTGFSVSTLQDWHYKKARAPFLRMGKRHARLVITPELVHHWLIIIAKANLSKKRKMKLNS